MMLLVSFMEVLNLVICLHVGVYNDSICHYGLLIILIHCIICNCVLDHLVILGNHRDAWTFGAVDPNSGTAVLMEIARILGDMKNRGILYLITVSVIGYYQ